MLDARLRPWIDRPLSAAGRVIAARGLSADWITVFGFAVGICGALAIASGHETVALALIFLNRVADGLDGAVARASKPTDRGGFLDITLDFAFYAAVPLAFAWYDSGNNALAAAFLLAAFLANGSAFLAFSVFAAKRALTTEAQGRKGIYYIAGLAEGAETIAVFTAMCIWPSLFPLIATAFGAVCLLSAAGRTVIGWRIFGYPPA